MTGIVEQGEGASANADQDGRASHGAASASPPSGDHPSRCDGCGDDTSDTDEATELCEMCFEWAFGSIDGFRE
jgi:hypothetical protein